MQRCCDDNIKPGLIARLATRLFLFVTILHLFSMAGVAQCPPNIDFENGTFDNWTCYIGAAQAINGQNVLSITNSNGPVFNRHTMYNNPTNAIDPYGGFPVSCPNGSGHSIRLGNDQAGGQAEGISYEFTIPANQDVYSLIYHYAVVFQDPNHLPFQQPRMEIEITNITDNEIIYCSSFTFYPYGSLLPGFFISPIQVDTTNIWYKDWSAVSINLNGNAGKTIRLFFKTGDCTFTRHFGYAYIDVNSECSSEFVGATYCPDDAFVNVTAPFGYQSYTWFNNDFSQVLGNLQSIMFVPPPPVGTAIAVEVVPYYGYGCLDTLYAVLLDTLTIISNAGRDTLSCNQNPVPIGANPKPGHIYSWSPTAGLSDPNIANPRASPSVTTVYVLTTRNAGGGCADTDTVVVEASTIDTSITLLGKAAYCINTGDSAVLLVRPTDNIQWYKDNSIISGASQPRYKVTQSGNYYAVLTNSRGCVVNTSVKNILIESPRPGITYPVQYAVENYPQQLQARTFGTTVEWSPPTFLSSSTSLVPTFTGNTDKLYTIAITTASGCLTVDTQLVKVFKEVKFYVPSGFTPNNDGLNDYLKPLAVGIKEMKYFRVYNRWGQLIFDLKNDSRGWDGKIKGKLQPTQTVVWMAAGIGIDNRTYIQKGTCVLIR